MKNYLFVVFLIGIDRRRAMEQECRSPSCALELGQGPSFAMAVPKEQMMACNADGDGTPDTDGNANGTKLRRDTEAGTTDRTDDGTAGNLGDDNPTQMGMPMVPNSGETWRQEQPTEPMTAQTLRCRRQWHNRHTPT
jgi:hypothetical protein